MLHSKTWYSQCMFSYLSFAIIAESGMPGQYTSHLQRQLTPISLGLLDTPTYFSTASRTARITLGMEDVVRRFSMNSGMGRPGSVNT